MSAIYTKSYLLVLLIALAICSILVPFIVTYNFATVPQTISSHAGSPLRHSPESGESTPHAIEMLRARDRSSKKDLAPVPLPRKCKPGACVPRKYFATTNQQPPLYYLEPNLDPSGRHGMFSAVPSRPWNESSIAPLDLHSVNAVELVRKTIEWRYNELIESDLSWDSMLPKYLPPQFPQWDRTIQRHIASKDTIILGMPPECCPTNSNHMFLTKNWSEANVLTEEQLKDCKCRSPRNYPDRNNRPIATIVTAFYQMSSKHPVAMYEKSSVQLLATADPMIIFCEPKSSWVTFFQESRKHAPTIVIPLASNELRLKKRFPQETFWKNQYEIDPESPTYHKNVNTMLYIIWDEKLILLHSAAMLNPFNTTQFVWVDTGYWRNPAPHLWRQSAVRINITQEGVNDDATLLFQMRPDNNDREVIINGNEVLVGGNSFAGTYNGISNLYSAFYETFWTMAATGKFVGSDQKVLYRTCHTYPNACHIHIPKKMRSWFGMLGELLPDIGGQEKIKEPLKISEIIPPEENLPLPPNGIVNNATSELIWRGVVTT